MAHVVLPRIIRPMLPSSEDASGHQEQLLNFCHGLRVRLGRLGHVRFVGARTASAQLHNFNVYA